MADNEDKFRVRLGRIGNRRGRKAIGYIKRIRKIAKEVSPGRQRRASDFTGSRIGRGYAQGTVFAGRRPKGQRRVVIKARIVRIKAGDVGAVRAHLRYVQRDGVTREGNPGELYDAGHDRADGKAFAERTDATQEISLVGEVRPRHDQCDCRRGDCLPSRICFRFEALCDADQSLAHR